MDGASILVIPFDKHEHKSFYKEVVRIRHEIDGPLDDFFNAQGSFLRKNNKDGWEAQVYLVSQWDMLFAIMDQFNDNLKDKSPRIAEEIANEVKKTISQVILKEIIPKAKNTMIVVMQDTEENMKKTVPEYKKLEQLEMVLNGKGRDDSFYSKS